MLYSRISYIFIILLLSSCLFEDPKETFSSFNVSPGDIVVTSTGADSAYLLNEDGSLKGVILDRSATGGIDNFYGLGWKDDTQEVMVTIDGVNEGIFGVSAETGAIRKVIGVNSLTGVLRGAAQISGTDDILVIESNVIERFDTSGTRITAGGWPRGLQNISQQINPLSAGGFVLCSTGADAVRTYDADGIQQATASSGIGGTTNCYGTVELPNGNIAAAWNGTTDTITIYSPDLSSVIATYSDVDIMPNPRGIAARENGNILIVDNTRDNIIEIDSNGNFVRTLGQGLDTLQQILVIPSF